MADTESEQKTLVHEPAPVSVELASSALNDAPFSERYTPRYVLGRGGMGEVRVCRDERIGRDVALKTILADGPSTTLEHRFLREGRVQAQLEHPSIVPVYDMGRTPDDRPYFTMKRVQGLSLSAVVTALSQGDQTMAERFGLRRLVTLFNQACLAVDYAHRHGVVHRDIKPDNIMAGDFGEVYLLDWGLAKLGAAEGPAAASGAKATAKGAVLGTPGYMAPEQVAGTDRIDARTDVYALGAVLFELLTLTPLVEGETTADLFSRTLSGVDARASVRAPDRGIPPELDGICVRATQSAPDRRFQSARELSDALDRFLDGDRDTAVRRELAERHLKEAADLMSGPGMDAARRAQATAALGRALALDPGNPSALEALLRLIQTPVTEIPEEVESELTARENDTLRLVRRTGSLAYASFLLFVPLLVWMGVRDWSQVAAMLVCAAAAMVASLVARAGKSFVPLFFLTLFASTAAIAFVGRMFGPYFLGASIAAVNVLGLCLIRPRGVAPWPLVASIGSGAVLVPTVFEALGWISPSYLFADGTMIIVPHLVDLHQVPTSIVLLLVNLMVIAFPAAVFGVTRTALDRAELDLRMRAWQLRALVPTRRASSPP
jgi:serine/threonine-protein kinase